MSPNRRVVVSVRCCVATKKQTYGRVSHRVSLPHVEQNRFLPPLRITRLPIACRQRSRIILSSWPSQMRKMDSLSNRESRAPRSMAEIVTYNSWVVLALYVNRLVDSSAAVRTLSVGSVLGKPVGKPIRKEC